MTWPRWWSRVRPTRRGGPRALVGRPEGLRLVAADPGLWSRRRTWRRAPAPPSTMDAHDRRGCGRHGRGQEGRRTGASLGVNAGAVTIMLATFAHTGGITGAEVGIAAATAFLNQKLMNALSVRRRSRR